MPTFRATRHHILGTTTPLASMGGCVIVPKGTILPKCTECGNEMLLFFQFDIEERFELPFQPGSHLVVLMCAECNEIPTFAHHADGKLPPRFWKETEGHFFVALYRPDQEQEERQTAPYLEPFSLDFSLIEGDVYPCDSLRVGGQPYWLQSPEQHFCPCGEQMRFICQLPENYGFPKCPNAPEQPDSFSPDDYCLFLGNEVYVFGCANQCNERAVWVVVQG